MSGQILNGTYRIDEVIGTGGMSVVFRGWHLRLNKPVAIKQIMRSRSDYDFAAEAGILKDLDHPMLPRIYDIFQDANTISIVMDYVDGEPLDRVIAKRGIIDEKNVLTWFRQLCDVLKYLHDQKPYPIIYRDMKPSNIMLQKDGRMKLIDFGIAKFYNMPGSKTKRGGTKGYGAPEQFAKGGVSDARTDIYSLGQTVFHLATGKSPLVEPYPPYAGDARSFNPAVSKSLAAILKKCMNEDPSLRYQNMDQLIYDIDHIGQSEEAYRNALKKKKRRKRIITGCVLCAFVLTAGLVYVRSRSQINTYQSLIEAAENASEEEGLKLAQQAEDLMPENSAAYVEELGILYNSSSYQAVVSRYRQLVNSGILSADQDGEAALIAASSCYELGDYEEAEELYQVVYSSDSLELSVDSMLNYAASLAQIGEKSRALEVLEKARGNADDAQIDYMDGQIHALNGEYREAVSYLQSALDQSSDASLKKQCLLSLTEAYAESYEQGKDSGEYIEDANTKIIDAVNKAMTDPSMNTNAVLWERLGQAYYRLGVNEKNNDVQDLVSSAQAYHKVLDLGIQKDYLYLNIYAAYEAADMFDEAGKILVEMKEAFPDSADPYIYNATRLIRIESEKPEKDRDYSSAYREYQTVEKKNVSDYAKPQMEQLETMIQQLKDYGWIE